MGTHQRTTKWYSLAILLVVITLLTGAGTVLFPASNAQQAPRVSVEDVTLGLDESVDVVLTLSDAPEGLIGFRLTVSLSDGSVGNFTSGSVADEFQPDSLQSVGVSPDQDSITIKATDLAAGENGAVVPGDSDIALGTVTVQSETEGQSSLGVTVDLMQDDQTPPQQFSPAIDPGQLTVRSTDQSPKADAGADQAVEGGAVVQLDASGSSHPEGEQLTYEWTGVDGSSIRLSDPTSPAPSFTAPTVESEQRLQFEVTVRDGNGGSDTDTVNVTVEPSSETDTPEPPTTDAGTPPVADAGADQTVDEGAMVQLDASGSSDDDQDQLTFQWTQRSGPSVTLSDPTSETPTFTSPSITSPTTLTFEVEVSDRSDGSDTDTVAITVEPTDDSNTPPIADAGDDQTVDAGEFVPLDASESSDPDDDQLAYEWVRVAGPSVTLSDPTSPTPSFTAPMVETQQQLQFEVTVRDGSGGVDSDTVNVTVKPTTEQETLPILDVSVACTPDGADMTIRNTGDEPVEVRDLDDAGQSLFEGVQQLGAGESTTISGVNNGEFVIQAFDPASGNTIGDSVLATVDCDSPSGGLDDGDDGITDNEDDTAQDESSPLDVSVGCTLSGGDVTVTNTGEEPVEVRDLDDEGLDVIDGAIQLGEGESTTLTNVDNGEVVVISLNPISGDQLGDSITTTVDCTDASDEDSETQDSGGSPAAESRVLNVSVACTVDGANVTVNNTAEIAVEIRDLDSAGLDVLEGVIELGAGNSTNLSVRTNGDIVLQAFDPDTGDPLDNSVTTSVNCEGANSQPVAGHNERPLHSEQRDWTQITGER